jgi:hypothetical protein
MSEDCHDSTGGTLPNAFQKHHWCCAVCGAQESAYSREILDLRAQWHMNREHRTATKDTPQPIKHAPKNYDELKLNVLDREFFNQCGIKVE